MTKDELIKATQILQKHVPNRFPLENPYINAMQEYADQETTEKNSEIERLKAELNELKEEIAILKAEKRIAFDLGYKTATSEAIAEIRKNYKPND